MQFPWGARPLDPTQWISYCNYMIPEGDEKRSKVPTFPVRFFENGKSRPFGLYEMAGNVAEWTSSSYLKYENNVGYDENYSNERKVIRGGSFLNEGRAIMASRCSFRDSRLPNDRPADVGFRCVKPQKPPAREPK
jgi:formylglycine-generating enzyme required for sulfatase activity